MCGRGMCPALVCLSRRALSVVRRASLSALLVALVAIAVSLPGSRPVRPLIDIYPLNVLYNIVLAVDRTERLENYESTSSSFSAHAVDLSPSDSARRVVVIVVGGNSPWRSLADQWIWSPDVALAGCRWFCQLSGGIFRIQHHS